MATINFNVQDISGVTFKPINSKRKHPYKSAKVAPASEEYIAPKAQVPMYDRWSDNFKHVKVRPYAQVPMYNRWMNDSVG